MQGEKRREIMVERQVETEIEGDKEGGGRWS